MGQHATRPAYISVRQSGRLTNLFYYVSVRNNKQTSGQLFSERLNSVILQNRNPGFLLHGIRWGQKHEIFHGDSMGFHAEYSMEFLRNTTFSMIIPWNISH